MNPMGKYSGQGPRPVMARPGGGSGLPQGPMAMPGGMDPSQAMPYPPGMQAPSMPAPNTPQVSLPAQGPGQMMQQGMARPGSGAFGQVAPQPNPFTQRTRPIMADALQARAGTAAIGSAGNGG